MKGIIMSLREQARVAAKQILGNESFEAAIAAKINLIRILECAAIEAFILNLQDEKAEHLRQALKQVNETNILE